jgi:hypothetical protein
VLKHVINWNCPLKGVVQVEAIHANNAAATSVSRQSILSEAAVADEQSARPIHPRIELTLKSVKVCCGRQGVVPFCFQQIRLASKHKAAVYLFAGCAESAARQKSERTKTCFRKASNAYPLGCGSRLLKVISLPSNPA